MPKEVYTDHNKLVLDLQSKFYEGEESLSQMYCILKVMSERMVRRYFASKKLRVPEYLIQERGHDIATEQITRYLRNPKYKLRSPSGSVRNGPFLRYMFQDVNHDRILSLEKIIEDEDLEEYEKPFTRMF